MGICDDCLCDTIMWRFAEVKAERIAQLALDMNAASDEIAKQRRKFRAEQNRRREVGHYKRLTSARSRQEDAAERELEEQRRFGETVEETKARLQADLKAWERTSAQKLVEAELRIWAKFGLHEDVRLYDSTRRAARCYLQRPAASEWPKKAEEWPPKTSSAADRCLSPKAERWPRAKRPSRDIAASRAA